MSEYHHHHHHHHHVEARCEVMRRLDALDDKLTSVKEEIMATVNEQFQVLKGALDQIGTAVDGMTPEVTKIGTETSSLLQKITDLQNSGGGLTPDQQTLLDSMVVQAQGIVTSATNLGTSLKNVDDLVPDATP